MKSPEQCDDLDEVRRVIDVLDREIVRLIGRRAGYVKRASHFKTDEASVRAPERQKAMLAERRKWAEEEGLVPDVVEELYKNLIRHFVAREMESLRRNPEDG